MHKFLQYRRSEVVAYKACNNEINQNSSESELF